MGNRIRLDLELVRRGLVETRSEAQRVIEQGLVTVGGAPARAARLVSPDDSISLRPERTRFVSRGGDKLDSALSRFPVEVRGRRWLDAGASTGGFTDRLLQGGAAEVAAVDVGYGQLDWSLRNDERVTVLERTNVRHLRPADLPWPPDGVVADLSFISLRLVLRTLVEMASREAVFLLLVKPQFEAGKELVAKGVVRDPEVWRRSIEDVVEAGRAAGLRLAGVAPAEPPGPKGNREFFVLLDRNGGADEDAVARAVREVAP